LADTSIVFELTSAAHWGEDANGEWLLHVDDQAHGDDGVLLGWTMEIHGSATEDHDDYIYTNEFGQYQFSSDGLQILTDEAGTDRINAAAVSSDTIINLNQGALNQLAGGEFVIAEGTVIENVIAGDGNDSITGNDARNDLDGARGDDTLSGGAGDDDTLGMAEADTINGMGGNDTVDALDGDDFIEGGTGNDSVDGGDGADRLIGDGGLDTLQGGAGADSLEGRAGADRLDGGEGDDMLYGGGGDDTLIGRHDDDRIWGHEGNDLAYGGDGADVISGDAGNDRLLGDAGADTLDGGAGDDVIEGRAGNDDLTGGAGADQFRFFATDGADSADTIADFTVGEDGFRLYSLTVDSVVDVDTDGAGGADATLVTFSSGATATLLGVTGIDEADLF